LRIPFLMSKMKLNEQHPKTVTIAGHAGRLSLIS
jgi:hypothetical protein